MGNDTRSPASLEARLAVLCETIARLRAGMDGHTLSSALGAGRSGPEEAADGSIAGADNNRALRFR
jgi:hypothetical protein